MDVDAKYNEIFTELEKEMLPAKFENNKLWNSMNILQKRQTLSVIAARKAKLAKQAAWLKSEQAKHRKEKEK